MTLDLVRTKNHGADILRGVAILMVVVFHAFGPAYGFFLPWNGWFRDFASPPSQTLLWFYPITFGWAGVALFFVLSGFCIHLSFLRSSSFRTSHFFWRRFWRIYPAYVIALLAFTLLEHIDVSSHYGVKQLLSHLLLIHNFSEGTIFTINPSFWSIATEVQLYLLYPLLLAVSSRFGIGGCLVVTFVVGMVWRAISIYRWGLPEHLITPAWTSPFMTWFDWTLGAFVANRFFKGERAFRYKRLLLGIFIPAFVASTLYKPLTTFSFSLAAVCSAIILDSVLYVRWKKSFLVEVCAFIGVISYSLYLWHQPLLFDAAAWMARFTNSPFIAWCLIVPFLLCGAWLSFRFIEQIGIRMGDSLWIRMMPNQAQRIDRAPASPSSELPPPPVARL